MFFASHLYLFVCEINMLDVIQSELQPIMAKKTPYLTVLFSLFFSLEDAIAALLHRNNRVTPFMNRIHAVYI